MSLTDRLETLLSGPLVMAASLHAATEVWRQRADRRRGHDASEGEPEEQARAHLREAAEVLSELAFRATADEVALGELDRSEAGAYVLRFETLLGLNRAAGLLEDVHRRLLSLYPDVDSGLVERARILAASCRAALEHDGIMPIADVRRLVYALEEVLSP
jgi:hypothetical protein